MYLTEDLSTVFNNKEKIYRLKLNFNRRLTDFL
nr:MAG TPA: hypothetical protein [Caudoviricetes sp.]